MPILLLSLLFSRQVLFSMDTQWMSLASPPTEERIPWSLRVVSRAHRRICRCCVVAVWVLHHSSNEASTDAWSGLQCGNSRPWLGICSGSVSHVLVPDIPSCPQVPCGVCSGPSHMVVDFQSNERSNWCTRSQTRVPQEVRRTWFSHGLLASLGPLYGWGEHKQGPQSWLFCPIISLALAVVERARGVTPFSTGPRSVVPPAQEQYWMTHAAAIVDFLASHFQSFSPQSQIAQVLQSQSSWVGGEHLPGPQQELCVPQFVSDSESTWLGTQCEQFTSGRHQVAAVLSPSPFLNMQVETPVASPRSPFQNAVVNRIDTSGQGSPIVVSNRFVTMPVAAERPPSQSTFPFQFPEGGPVRLTRFVEMPLDVYYARVNGMIQSGVFEDIGRATIRFEEKTACGVWFCIDHLEYSFWAKAAIAMWGPLSFG